MSVSTFSSLTYRWLYCIYIVTNAVVQCVQTHTVLTRGSLSYRGKIVLGYTEAELRVRGSGYQFIHAADMLYCAENHVRSE